MVSGSTLAIAIADRGYGRCGADARCGRRRRICCRAVSARTSAPGEQVIFQGHPSWRAILGFYLKGILRRGRPRRLIAKLVDGDATTVLVIVVVVIGARPS